MSHVVLLGDSIFDNARYVPGGSPVIEQLRAHLPREWRATLLAVDGAVAADVLRQFARLPADSSHLVVSVGGNDALMCSNIVADASVSAPDAFRAVADAQRQFRDDYRDVIRSLRAVGKPAAVCTIYDSIPTFPPEAMAALSVFNDVILREAFQARLPVVDLRLICDEARDYAAVSPIEPSEIGGAKIVRAIRRLVTGHDFGRGESVVYGK
jgi:GDSL-like Lipase/Acylhydrolase family